MLELIRPQPKEIIQTAMLFPEGSPQREQLLSLLLQDERFTSRIQAHFAEDNENG